MPVVEMRSRVLFIRHICSPILLVPFSLGSFNVEVLFPKE